MARLLLKESNPEKYVTTLKTGQLKRGESTELSADNIVAFLGLNNWEVTLTEEEVNGLNDKKLALAQRLLGLRSKEETIKYITDNYINRNRREIIKEYQEEYPESEAHLVTIMNVWDNALKGKDFGKQHIRGIKSLTQILFWEQKNLDVDVHNKILKILNPKYIKEELDNNDKKN